MSARRDLVWSLSQALETGVLGQPAPYRTNSRKQIRAQPLSPLTPPHPKPCTRLCTSVVCRNFGKDRWSFSEQSPNHLILLGRPAASRMFPLPSTPTPLNRTQGSVGTRWCRASREREQRSSPQHTRRSSCSPLSSSCPDPRSRDQGGKALQRAPPSSPPRAHPYLV
jgi:hypothetical protein